MERLEETDVFNNDEPNNAKRANKDIAMSISTKDKPFIGPKPL